jgi:hypothetical protein
MSLRGRDATRFPALRHFPNLLRVCLHTSHSHAVPALPLSDSCLTPNRFLLKTHDHSPLARAMHTAIRQARLNDKFQEPLYLFLELVRAGVMHGNLWSSRAFSGGPSFGTGACIHAQVRACSHGQTRRR